MHFVDHNMQVEVSQSQEQRKLMMNASAASLTGNKESSYSRTNTLQTSQGKLMSHRLRKSSIGG